MTRYSYPMGAFCIEAIPNQPQVAHCHSFFVYADKRGKGLAHDLKHQQNVVLAAQGFDYATCTTCAENVRQHKVLKNAGWKQLSRFKNRATGGDTFLWGYEVPK